MSDPNARQAEYWNAAEHWITAQAEHDDMLEALGRHAQAVLAPQPGERILDVGCGTGTTTLQLADAVGPSGRVVGLDVSGLLLTLARERSAGRANVSFVEADAQTHMFGDHFDAAFSRFGVMFFGDPVAAFTNIGRAIRSEGRVAFVCWQAAERNEWWTLGARVAAQLIDLAPPANPNEPGPFALADRSRLERILGDAGFDPIDIDDVRVPILLGGHGTVDTAVKFLRDSRLGRQIEEGAQDEAGAERVYSAIAEALEPHLTDRGVEMEAAVWVVTARPA